MPERTTDLGFYLYECLKHVNNEEANLLLRKWKPFWGSCEHRWKFSTEARKNGNGGTLNYYHPPGQSYKMKKIRSAPDLRRYLDICGKTYESEPGRFVQSDGRLSDDFFAVCLAEYKSIRNKVRNRKRD